MSRHQSNCSCGDCQPEQFREDSELDPIGERIAELERENAELRNAYKAAMQLLGDAAAVLGKERCVACAEYYREEARLGEQWLAARVAAV